MIAQFAHPNDLRTTANALVKYVCEPDTPSLAIAENGSLRERVRAATALDRGASGGQSHLLILPSSGTSRARPHLVALSHSALLASAEATHRTLGGPGRWITALPLRHIAGVQTVVRSAAAGLTPILLEPGPFTSAALAQAIRKAVSLTETSVPLYLSLVSAQLSTALADHLPELRQLGAILLGGGFIDSALLEQATAQGLRVVQTYGMTETAGGCVYDGRPLPGVEVASVEGRILVAGSTLMEGYLDEPSPWLDRGGQRWLRTNDLGSVNEDGVLTIVGRSDDLIKSGGVKVNLQSVSEVLQRAGAANRTDLVHGWGEVCVIARNDPKWGQQVCVVAEVSDSEILTQDRVKQIGAEMHGYVRAALGAPSAPRTVALVPRLPRTAIGKLDRGRARALLEDRIRQGRAWQR